MNFQEFGRIVSGTYRQQSRYIARNLEPLGITVRLLGPYMEISRHEPVSPTELTRVLESDKIAVAKSLRTLTQLSYIETVRDENDGRSKNIRLSEEGRRILPEVREVLDRLDGLAHKGASDRELETASRVLDAFRLAIMAELENSNEK